MSEYLIERYFAPVKGLLERVGIHIDLGNVCMYSTCDLVAGDSVGESDKTGRNIRSGMIILVKCLLFLYAGDSEQTSGFSTSCWIIR